MHKCTNAQTHKCTDAQMHRCTMYRNFFIKMKNNVHSVLCALCFIQHLFHCTMTIDSSWLAGMKCDAPDAFTTHAPFAPQCVFIDGQIRLMCPTSVAQTLTWDQYVSNQFERPVEKYLRVGVRGVVLAFDDYAHVPAAKSMTQIKRRRNIPVLEFSDRSQLPPTVPVGEKWAACISNRAFKTMVIKMAIDQLVQRIPKLLGEGQSFIVDYQGSPVRYTRDGLTVLDGFEGLGEADVKFPRYTSMFPFLQVWTVKPMPPAALHWGADLLSFVSSVPRPGRVWLVWCRTG